MCASTTASSPSASSFTGRRAGCSCASSMSDSAVLRPGIALGPYPQREDLRDSWLERTAASLTGLVRQQAYGRNPGYDEFLALVNVEGDRLAGLSDDQIKAEVPELRRRLYSEGLGEVLVARSFAIV